MRARDRLLAPFRLRRRPGRRLGLFPASGRGGGLRRSGPMRGGALLPVRRLQRPLRGRRAVCGAPVPRWAAVRRWILRAHRAPRTSVRRHATGLSIHSGLHQRPLRAPADPRGGLRSRSLLRPGTVRQRRLYGLAGGRALRRRLDLARPVRRVLRREMSRDRRGGRAVHQVAAMHRASPLRLRHLRSVRAIDLVLLVRVVRGCRTFERQSAGEAEACPWAGGVPEREPRPWSGGSRATRGGSEGARSSAQGGGEGRAEFGTGRVRVGAVRARSAQGKSKVRLEPGSIGAPRRRTPTGFASRSEAQGGARWRPPLILASGFALILAALNNILAACYFSWAHPVDMTSAPMLVLAGMLLLLVTGDAKMLIGAFSGKSKPADSNSSAKTCGFSPK